MTNYRHTVGGSATRNLRKKPNPEIRDSFTKTTSFPSEIASFQLEAHRNPRDPGHPGKILVVSWHASSLYQRPPAHEVPLLPSSREPARFHDPAVETLQWHEALRPRASARSTPQEPHGHTSRPEQ